MPECGRCQAVAWRTDNELCAAHSRTDNPSSVHQSSCGNQLNDDLLHKSSGRGSLGRILPFSDRSGR